MAQHLGHRAVALGLTAEDMVAVQDFTETLKEKRKPESAATIIKREVAMQEPEMRVRVGEYSRRVLVLVQLKFSASGIL